MMFDVAVIYGSFHGGIGVAYGNLHPEWPSYSFWIVPGTLDPDA